MNDTLPSRLLRLVLLASLLAGCADQTSLMVEVTSSDLVVPDDVDELRFEVRSATGRSIDRRFSISGAWPHSLAVLPASSSDGAVVLTVTGLSGGAPVVRRVLETAFVSGLQRRVEVRLERACLGVQCGEGVDCVAGVCGGGVSDGGVDGGMEIRDGGVDGGASDAGSADAGTADAGGDMDGGGSDGGPRDGGPADAGPADAGGDDAGGDDSPRLLFTEYVEGSSNNKALEIQNLASASFDLTRCTLQRYSNGSTTPFPIPLTGSIAAGGFHVVCHASIAVTTGCDQLTSSLNHNGDDALVLACDGAATPIDSFGRIGATSMWTGGGISSEDHVLTRRCGAGPDTNPNDAFDPSVEWQGVAWPTAADPVVLLAGLGSRAPCP